MKPDDKPIDPFLAARKRVSVDASIQPHDVRAVRPDWTDDRIRSFLERRAAVIAHAMLIAGAEAIRQFVEDEEDAL